MLPISLIFSFWLSYKLIEKKGKILGIFLGSIFGLIIYFIGMLIENVEPGKIVIELIRTSIIFVICNSINLFFLKDKNRNNENENFKEIYFRGEKIKVPKKDLNYSNKKNTNKDENENYKKEKTGVEKELQEIEKLYKKKTISSKEREKMRNKVLGID